MISWPKATDDRGKPVAILRPPAQPTPQGDTDAVAAAVYRASWKTEDMNKRAARGSILGVLPATAAAYVTYHLAPALGEIADELDHIAAIAAFILVLLLYLFIAHWLRFERLEKARAASIMHEGLCPSCLCPLFGLPTEQDGCTVCPECDAAWRLDVRCPGCQYSVTGLVPDTEGFTTCPECGVGWRLARAEPLMEAGA